MLTTELRWFHVGYPPQPLAAWFRDCDIVPESRCDRYLQLHDDPFLNVKRRQGRLEMKWRPCVLGVQHIGPAAGQLEQWVKISSPDNLDLPQGDRQAGQWIPVDKVRWQLGYDTAGDTVHRLTATDAAAMDAVAPAAATCTAELTYLTLRGEAWWSFALEAAGARQPQSLSRAIAAMAVDGITAVLPLLSIDQSYGYALWLERRA